MSGAILYVLSQCACGIRLQAHLHIVSDLLSALPVASDLVGGSAEELPGAQQNCKSAMTPRAERDEGGGMGLSGCSEHSSGMTHKLGDTSLWRRHPRDSRLLWLLSLGVLYFHP